MNYADTATALLISVALLFLCTFGLVLVVARLIPWLRWQEVRRQHRCLHRKVK